MRRKASSCRRRGTGTESTPCRWAGSAFSLASADAMSRRRGGFRRRSIVLHGSTGFAEIPIAALHRGDSDSEGDRQSAVSRSGFWLERKEAAVPYLSRGIFSMAPQCVARSESIAAFIATSNAHRGSDGRVGTYGSAKLRAGARLTSMGLAFLVDERHRDWMKMIATG